MRAMNRITPRGIHFHLMETSTSETEIWFKTFSGREKRIRVNHDIERINQAWYDWCVSGLFIQSAFDFFTPSEREFLLTGMTQQEWDKWFKEEERKEGDE